ncbi:amidohydrolase [[Pantoea] beijingensis]|uniref:Amidohydrolase n=1 Tax=[Pantoea] beijingensis TaxID=1324864 RepID=A0A443IG29_9GAMM|nr:MULTISPECIES: amidohydrolase [Erwiniaceae]RWR03037.1 amidohydrolase [[Pantoea] beijingensis]
MRQRLQPLQNTIQSLLPALTDIYKDLHQNPELSMQEYRTAGIVAEKLAALGYEVHKELGVTGVVGILKNGPGKTVMLRADMDALPIEEKTNLPYASKVTGKTLDGEMTPVAHMCGHDLHVTWLLGAAEVMAKHRNSWTGTLMLVFQPGEECGIGALSMLKDMQDTFPKPDIILGQHVMPGAPGTVGYRTGVILSAGDSLSITFKGKGAHGAMPHLAKDPVMMAAYTAVRLQSIVSREIAPLDSAVLTIGCINAGTKENIIPDEAVIKLNMRSYSDNVREKMLSSVKKICTCESHASGAADPNISVISSYPVTDNDAAAMDVIREGFIDYFGDKAYETPPAVASEDFSQFGRKWQVPYVFWLVGGTDGAIWDNAVKTDSVNSIPANHSSLFTVSLDPALRTGMEAMLVGALCWL